MPVEHVLRIAQETLMTALIVSAPLLLVILVVGLIVSVLQAATSVQETSAPVIAKALATYAALAIVGASLLAQLVAFGARMFAGVADVGR